MHLGKNKTLLLMALILGLAFFLRIYRVSTLPPSLYWEEVALGYDAYSILKTGKDHHGHVLPLVAFTSFGDWKPAAYFYAVVPFIAVFGLSPLAVRLPSAISGVLIVLGCGELVWLGLRDKKIKAPLIALTAMIIVAISPWAIQFSRAAWEVNLATCFILWGVIFLWKGLLQDQKLKFKLILIGTILLILSMYAYHSARVLAPVLGVSLVILSWLKLSKKLWQGSQLKILGIAIIALMLLFPLIRSLGSTQTSQRFLETTIFSDLKIIEKSNHLQELHQHSFFSKLFYHRYVVFIKEILSNYLLHFNFNFLFLSGDNNPRHSDQYTGLFYYTDLILLILGAGFIYRHRSQSDVLLFIWLLIGILPASISKAAPHALRILPTLPVFIYLISLGVLDVFTRFSQVKQLNQRFAQISLVLILLIVYGLQFGQFWRFYTRVYPQRYSQLWQYGYAEMVAGVKQLMSQYPELPVFITREQGRPAMYYWFFSQTDPQEVQAVINLTKKDQGEVLEFERIKFIYLVSEVHDRPAIVASSMVGAKMLDQNFSPENSYEIRNLNNDPVWIVSKVE